MEHGAIKRSVLAVAALGGLAACAALGLGTKPDRDHDGIADERDLCPDAPEDFNGHDDWDGCPDEPVAPAGALTDTDHDGIPDRDDLCPQEPEDRDGFEDGDGCPDPDNDKDRIPDVADKCPNEPETYNGFEDDDGCPDGAGVKVVRLEEPRGGPPPPEAAPDTISKLFERHVAELRGADAAALARRFHASGGARGPSFDVQRAKFFDLVTSTLQMTPEELSLLQTTGVAGVDHRQRNSMASLYWAIYARDLPVLITSDSMLHALHRSFDKILQALEVELFSPAMARVLEGVEAKVAAAAAEVKEPGLRESLGDVDLYVTVARNLLAGGGALPDEKDPKAPFSPVASVTNVDAEVGALLDQIAKLGLQQPQDRPTTLRGGNRLVDFSQFRPRGHYALTAPLRRYFRTMMWLGRPDLGFVLDTTSGLNPDPERELRAAATLVLLLRQSGGGAPLQAIGDVVDFLVGASDDVTLMEVATALDHVGVARLDDLLSAPKLARLGDEVKRLTPARGQILGNVEISNPGGPPTVPPKVVQLFGQRFAIDSFVLSKVVYDAVPLHPPHEARFMPSGLDVMAALGSDEALSLLAPDIERYDYAPQLGAARLTVGEQPPARWSATAYGTWLDALRTLDDAPDARALFPHAMRTEAWRRKQLQTQLASWTELRHDTILYVKQSYTVILGCSYPAAYVEPYPAFFARLGELTVAMARHLRAIDLSAFGAAPAAREPKASKGARPPDLGAVRDGQVGFLEAFAARMRILEKLARKELAGQPFTDAETEDLKRAITMRRGSGGARYDGWYAGLIYGGDPAKLSPTISDVHTDPNAGKVLEEGVGDATFLVVAVDNKADRALYVGPAYTYYELEAPADKRMTDAEWEAKLAAGGVPPRPAWTGAFQGPAVERSLAPAPDPDRIPRRPTPGESTSGR